MNGQSHNRRFRTLTLIERVVASCVVARTQRASASPIPADWVFQSPPGCTLAHHPALPLAMRDLEFSVDLDASPQVRQLLWRALVCS
jgi:hypothetical protein